MRASGRRACARPAATTRADVVVPFFAPRAALAICASVPLVATGTNGRAAKGKFILLFCLSTCVCVCLCVRAIINLYTIDEFALQRTKYSIYTKTTCSPNLDTCVVTVAA